MLFNPHPSLLVPDFVLAMVAAVNNRSADTKKLADGVYEIGHFGGTSFLRDFEHYPELKTESGEWFGPYGVCDNYQQILDQCPTLANDENRRFVITLTRVTKDPSNFGKGGGWRWHKWGAYIGTRIPQCEYLDDEPEIDEVFTYHIYEAK